MIKLLDIGFRFGAIGLLALLGLLVLRQKRERVTTLAAVAFAVGLIAYLLCSAPFWADLPQCLQVALVVGCIANPLFFWLLARSIFEDGFKIQPLHAFFFIAIEALGLWYVFGLRGDGQAPSIGALVGAKAGAALQFIAIAFLIGALVTAYRGRAPDLVENRRKFRTLFVSGVGAYMIFVSLVEVFLRGEAPNPSASMLNAGAIFAIVFVVAVSLLTIRFNLLLEPISPTVAAELDMAERALLQRLDEAIAGKVYRQEGLTIGQLARELQTQEHRLRVLINSKMGFRNFNDFLNQHRIAEACLQLADPAMAGLPILTIGLSLGYGSIGPFNRAFKQATGVTPTVFRRHKLSHGGDLQPATSTEDR